MFEKQEGNSTGAKIWLSLDPEKVRLRINAIAERLERVLSKENARSTANDKNNPTSFWQFKFYIKNKMPRQDCLGGALPII